MRTTIRTTGVMPARDLRLRHLMFAEGDAGAGSPAPAPQGGQDGGNVPDGVTAAPAPPAPAGAPAAGAPAAAPQAAPPAEGGDGDGETLPDDPAALQRMVRDLRRENGSARTTAKAQAADEARAQLAQDIGKALGLVTDEQQAPDPAALTAQAQQAQARARQAQVELAVFRGARTHHGDPDALLDSRAFLAKVVDLDPTAEDFSTKVDAAIKAAVDTNPKLKTAQVAGASGAEFTGGPGEQRTPPAKDLTSAVSAHYGA